MSSLRFPDTGTRMAVRRDGQPAVNAVGRYYKDEVGSVPAEIYADSLGVKGALISGSTLTTAVFGQQVDFWGPADGQDRLWASFDNGPLVPVDADYNARLDVTATKIAVATSAFAAVGNTTADTALAALTIPANTIRAGDVLTFECGGTLLNSSGGTINHTLRFKLGATTVLTTPVLAISTNAADREWYLRALIVCPTTSTQKVSAVWSFSLADAANWGGGSSPPTGYGTAAEASSAALDVVFSLQPATASASHAMQAQWALLSRI